MNDKLIIFGVGDIAELAFYYFTNDSNYDVVAFVVDAEFKDKDEFCGLPVIAFDEVMEVYPSSDYFAFVAMSYSRINKNRKLKYEAFKELSYRMASYISSRATVLNDMHIGENCFILEDNTIQPYVNIGNNVTLWSGNHIGHHSSIKDHVFIASHVVVSGGVTIDECVFVGVNATLRDHISVGKNCVLGAGVILLSDAESDGVYIGKETERSKVPSSRLKNI